MPGSPARSAQRLKTRDVTGGGQDTYTYDAHGTLVKRANADGTSAVYVGGVYEATYDAGGALTGTTKYYQAFGRTIAMRSSSVAACASAPCYLLADHLGSTVGMTDSSGSVLSTQKYWPYGAVRSGSLSQTDKLYTGQQIEPGDSALGLYNYKARFYSTVTGTFASADTSTKDGYNRFAYVRGNPATHNDPTGHGAPGIVPTAPGHPCTPDDSNDAGDVCNVTYHAPVSDPCDYGCTLRGIDAYCHGWGASDPSCGGGGPVAEPAPTPSCPPSCAPEPDTRESSGGCGGLCDFGKELVRTVAEGVCAETPGCQVVKVVIVDTGFYKTQCFRGLTKFGGGSAVFGLAFASGAGEAGVAWEATGSALTAGAAFGIGFQGPTGATPARLWGMVNGAYEDVRYGCF